MHDLRVHFYDKVKDSINMHEHLKTLNCVMNVIKNRFVGYLWTKYRCFVSKCLMHEKSEQGLHNCGLINPYEYAKFIEPMKEQSFCMHHLIGNIESVTFTIGYNFLVDCVIIFNICNPLLYCHEGVNSYVVTKIM